jgi:hypothetical protein
MEPLGLKLQQGKQNKFSPYSPFDIKSEFLKRAVAVVATAFFLCSTGGGAVKK